MMQKQLEINPFPGPHTYVPIPKALTAFIIGHNGEKVKKLHSLTGAYIFIPKDFNALTDERIIQLSGNDKSVASCKSEIKRIVKEIAPMLGIDLDEFKATKKVIEENFKKVMKQQLLRKGGDPSVLDDKEALEMINQIKQESQLLNELEQNCK